MKYAFWIILVMCLVGCPNVNQSDIDSDQPSTAAAASLSSTGFICAGTECRCAPDAPAGAGDPLSCEGMKDSCNSRGETVTCEWPPGKCTCPFNPSSETQPERSGVSDRITDADETLASSAPDGASFIAPFADAILTSPFGASSSVATTGDMNFVCTNFGCTCEPGRPDTDRHSCRGMLNECERRGSKTICSYPPSGPNLCSC
jgi:hypothetical protein